MTKEQAIAIAEKTFFSDINRNVADFTFAFAEHPKKLCDWHEDSPNWLVYFQGPKELAYVNVRPRMEELYPNEPHAVYTKRLAGVGPVPKPPAPINWESDEDEDE